MILGPRGDHSIKFCVSLFFFGVAILFCSFKSVQAEPAGLQEQIEEVKRIHFVHARLLEEVFILNEDDAENPNYSLHAKMTEFISENLRMLTAPIEELVHYANEQASSVSQPRTEEEVWKLALIFSVLRARQDLGDFSELPTKTRSKILGLRAKFSADPVFVKTTQGKVVYSEENIKDFYRSFFFSGAAELSGVKDFADLGVHDLLDSIEWSSDQNGQYSKVVLEAFDAYVDSGVFDIPSKLAFNQFIVKLSEMRGRLGVLLLILQKNERLTKFLRSHIVLRVFSEWMNAVKAYALSDGRLQQMSVSTPFEDDLGHSISSSFRRTFSRNEFYGLAENGLNLIALSGSAEIPLEYIQWIQSEIKEQSKSIRSADDLIEVMKFEITENSGFGFEPDQQLYANIQALKVSLVIGKLSSALITIDSLDDFVQLLKLLSSESERSRIEKLAESVIKKLPSETFLFATQLAFFTTFLSGTNLKELGQSLLTAKLNNGLSLSREEAFVFLPVAYEAVKYPVLLDLLDNLKADPSKEIIKIKIARASALRSKVINCLSLVASLFTSPSP